MSRSRLLKAVSLGVAVLMAPLLAGCSDDDKADPPASQESSTSNTTASTDSTQPSTSTEAEWVPEEVFPTGEEAMARMVEAWRAGDTVTAGRVAPPDAVVSLFSIGADGYEQYQDCGDADFGQQLCAYRNRSQGGFVQFQMEQQPTGGWYVISVTVDPSG